jgi:hypothetical protein
MADHAPRPQSKSTSEPVTKPWWRRLLRLRYGLPAGGLLTLAAIIWLSLAFKNHTGRLPGLLETLNPAKISAVEQEGKKYSHGTCSGSDIKQLTHVPIDAGAITTVLPYGGVVGAHIMPISHAYIWPGQPGGPRDQFNVYAMADSTLFYISSRSINVDKNIPKAAEFSLQFSVSCVEFYYYDLMTSLAPELQKYLDQHPAQQAGGNSVQVNIPVTAGQILGKIGGQTLDYAVWDFNKTLTGYVQPEHYAGDYPRLHLVSPFDYLTDDVRQALVSKLVRSVEPLAGKVDYDVDGKLVGGWFTEGSNYYTGADQRRYWAGHLAIVPDYIDPTLTLISIGTYGTNEEGQFALSRQATDPAAIGVETGLVQYDLYQIDHTKSDGSMWDRTSPATGLKGRTNGPSQGCALLQLTEARKLKAEFFPRRACSTGVNFTSAARIYTR